MEALVGSALAVEPEQVPAIEVVIRNSDPNLVAFEIDIHWAREGLGFDKTQELLQFLRSVVDDLGQTVVMVTHDPGAAAYADRVVFLVDGAIVEELTDPTREGVLEIMGRLGG